MSLLTAVEVMPDRQGDGIEDLEHVLAPLKSLGGRVSTHSFAARGR